MLSEPISFTTKHIKVSCGNPETVRMDCDNHRYVGWKVGATRKMRVVDSMSVPVWVGMRSPSDCRNPSPSPEVGTLRWSEWDGTWEARYRSNQMKTLGI